ncbi:MAG: hypothetical protein K6F80_01065 [Oscillospiraceae bacterium]|nr:hypothetical protein [Oscillospiraceae bacterium]
MDKRQEEADRILAAHVQDMVRRQQWRSFTAFLDMRQYTMLRTDLQEGTYRFFGGYPEAQRGILCIHPEGAEPSDEEFPVTCLTFTFPERFTLTHRDVLGSLMAQQVQRDTVGDILISAGKVQCFVTGAAVSVGESLTRIGRVGVKVSTDLPYSGDFHQETKEIAGTVQSPRLDAVLRTALGCGRERCLESVRAGIVTLNYAECTEPAKLLREGDIFSVRGYGKFAVKTIGAPTRKGRLPILILKYL